MAAKKLSVRISAPIEDALKAEAKKKGVSAANLAAQIITERMEAGLRRRFLAGPDVKAWQKMFGFQEDMSRSLAQERRVRQMHAFALNRAGQGQKAEKNLLDVIQSDGPSPETCGMLGRVYKDRWIQLSGAQAKEDLDLSVKAYLQGHDADRSNPYPGINALTLMTVYPKPPRRHAKLLRDVSQAVAERQEKGASDYWHHATRLELAMHQDRESEARAALKAALAAEGVPWMRESTLRNLSLLLKAAKENSRKPPKWWASIHRSLKRHLNGEVAKDLSRIEGIGPKISAILVEAGISSFAELAETSVEHITKILNKEGSRYNYHDPETWPKQAALLAEGRWEEIEALQEELLGGRHKKS